MSLPDPGRVFAPSSTPRPAVTVGPRRSSRIVAVIAVTGLLLAGVGTLFTLLWKDTATQARAVTAERDGAALLAPLTGLVDTLTVTRSVLARGGQVQVGPVRDATLAVDAADNLYGTRLGSHVAWSRLHDMLSTLVTQPGRGADGYQAFSDVISLVTKLIGDVADASGLMLDPDADSYYLVDVLVQRVPQVIVHAGQATDLVASAGGTPPVGEDAASLAVARYQVALATSQLVTAVKKSSAANAAVDLSTQQDALQDAVNQLSPPIVVAQLAAPVDAAALTAAAQRVCDGAQALAVAGWRQLDGLLADREHALQTRRSLTVAVGAGVVVSVVALLWILAPAGRRVVQDDDVEPAAPVEVPRPATLVDARGMLLEELVHVGRGVRARTRESSDDAE